MATIAWVSVGGFDPASLAIFAAFTTPPDNARKTVINTLVVALKGHGIWTKLDRLYVMAAADSQAARIEWKNPGTDTLSNPGSCAFTADRGFTGASAATGLAGATSFDTFTQWQQNSASLAVNVRTGDGTTTACENDASASTIITPTDTTNVSFALNNQFATATTLANTNAAGFFMGNRSAGTTIKMFRNGSSLGTGATASQAVDAGNLRALRFSAMQINLLSIGASLDAEAANYNTDIQAYMTSVGA